MNIVCRTAILQSALAYATVVVLLTLLAGYKRSEGDGHRLPQSTGGLKGYISMNVSRPPDGYGYGGSFYSSVWPLMAPPLSSFQIGLPSTWIIPDNLDFKEPLCPPGTVARDNRPERGPTYRDVFQTIEGGLGYWVSTQFGSATPKYRVNGTPDGYTHEISSTGRGFGNPKPLAGDIMGIAQISNRLLVPPDGLTFRPGANGQILGNAWMALPFTPAGSDAGVPTGDQSWTLFLNAANYKGPVVYWIPQTWSRLSRRYAAIYGRGLDARPAIMNGGAMEINTVPYFESRDAGGVAYSRLPQLQFPVDAQGRTVLMQDVKMYGTGALYAAMRTWLEGGAEVSGRFDTHAAWTPKCSSSPIRFRQGPRDLPLTGIDSVVTTEIFGAPGSSAFGLKWRDTAAKGVFPEYYKQVGDTMTAIPAAQVPAETHLTEQTFAAAEAGRPYTSPAKAGDCWSSPGPQRGPFRVRRSDGSTVTYAWYRFIDQPALQQLHMSTAERTKLQRLIERIHARWSVSGEYMPPPSSGRLATLDTALLVKPPRGLEIGYVPIVTRQE
jgi:hypothetical protein